MSQALAKRVQCETGVVARSQYALRVHRPDPDSDVPLPACAEATTEHAGKYRTVEILAVTPHYPPCQNPECFGGSEPHPDAGGGSA